MTILNKKSSKEKKNINDYIIMEHRGRKSRIAAIILTIAITIFIIVNRGLYFDPAIENGKTFFIISLCITPALCMLFDFKPHVQEPYKNTINTIAFIAEPLLAILMVECFNGVLVFSFSNGRIFANYLMVAFFYLVLWIITGRYHLSAMIVNTFLYIWSLTNYFVYLFRGTPLVPSDLLSIKTGLGVADGYTYSLSWNLILGTLLFLICIFYNHYVSNAKITNPWLRIIPRLAGLGAACILVGCFFLTDFPANLGFKPDFWDQGRGYKNHGSFFDFCLNTKYFIVTKPDGYDTAELEDYVRDTLADYGVDMDSDVSTNILTGENNYVASDGQMPNIICIMNESWTDFESIGDIELNEEAMPYFHNLTENTIKGNLHISVMGAGTSNSEFEFLTGNSIFFLPSGCNVYQSYFTDEVPSLVSTLGDLGYSKTAYHPYYGEGWNREKVYPLLGFDDFISIEDFVDDDILQTYKAHNNVSEYERLLKARYPDRNMLLRRFVSDDYDFQMVEDMYENRDPDQPFFIFNVTMQNHGGYKVSYSNFYQQIYIKSMSRTHQMADRYFSLLPHTDDALKSLIEYFSNVDEPTIICMFGDHQPAIETAFYEDYFGVDDLDDLTIEQKQTHYTTPFVIWANYDIPEATIDHMSSNYLSTLLSQLAGLPMTDYNKFLSVLYQSVPVTNAIGTIDSEGNYYYPDDETDNDELIRRYKCLEYNCLMDGENRVDSIFRLDMSE